MTRLIGGAWHIKDRANGAGSAVDRDARGYGTAKMMRPLNGWKERVELARNQQFSPLLP